MATRAEMSEIRREAVLKATGALLDEVGVSSLTIRDVAKRAGVAPGSVFLYAENKADLVNQVYGERIAARWHTLLDSLSNLPALDRVEQFYVRCVDVFYNDLENVQALYRALEGRTGGTLASVDRLLQRVNDALVEADAAGQLREGTDVSVLALTYQALYSNVLPLSHAGVSRERASFVVSESLRQLRTGVGTSCEGRG